MNTVLIVCASVVTLALVIVPWLVPRRRPELRLPERRGGVPAQRASAFAVAAPVINIINVPPVACQHEAQEPAGAAALRGRGVIPAIEAAGIVPAVVLEQEKVQR